MNGGFLHLAKMPLQSEQNDAREQNNIPKLSTLTLIAHKTSFYPIQAGVCWPGRRPRGGKNALPP